MRLTSRKKEIISYYEPGNLGRVISEIGPPPFDVFGITLMLHGPNAFESRYMVESTRRTLETMARDGLLEKFISYEQRQDRRLCGSDYPGVWCNVSRYGLPGSRAVLRDYGGKHEAIDGEAVRVD